MTVKELLENEELMNNIVEDIEEVPEDAVVTYEVWALGYGADDEVTDAEVLLGEFIDPDEAIACAEKLTLESVMEACDESEDLSDVAYFSLEVETVVEDEDDLGTMNIGSIYQRDLWIDGEYGTEEDVLPVVAFEAGEFQLLADNTILIRCELLKGFNKNDCLINIFYTFCTLL